jgi:hypothetical protein
MRRVIAGGLLLLAACSTGTGPDGWQRVVGRMEPELSSIQAVLMPAEAMVNVPFEVTLSTVGSSSCTRAAGALSSVAGRTAVITPYDLVAPPTTPCTRDLRAFPRTVSVKLTSTGEGLIRIRARGAEGRPTTFDVTIPVRGPR